MSNTFKIFIFILFIITSYLWYFYVSAYLYHNEWNELFEQKKYSKSIDSYKRGISILEERLFGYFPRQTSRIYNNLWLSYEKLWDNSKALKYYKISLGLDVDLWDARHNYCSLLNELWTKNDEKCWF